MKSPMTILLIMSMCLSFFCLNDLQAQETDVYVSAHPDDWQLFMNPNAYKSLQDSARRVIFLHTTAGDAGQGTGFNTYYKAREEGSLRAIRFLVNSLETWPPQKHQLIESELTVNGHPLQRMQYGRAIIYFLRLPDGNLEGPGYPVHANKSIEKFIKGEVKNIHTIDSSTIFKDANDLRTTLRTLILKEHQSEATIRFHIAETDTIRNPGDHSDHRYSSYLIQKMSSNLNRVELVLYEEYSTNQKPQNVFEDDYLISAGTWGATASGLSDYGHYGTWDKGHNSWIGRQYFRILIPD